MTVYVDPLFPTKPGTNWPYPQSCHMAADTSEELDAMAEQLGLNPRWKQHPGEHNEHYDLTASKRELAVKLGAVELTWRKLVEWHQRKRKEARRARQSERSLSS